jgi:hypothetical protein
MSDLPIAAASIPPAALLTADLPMLSVAAILAAQDLPEEVVPVPEWGGTVKVRGLSRATYDAIAEASTVAVAPTGPGQTATTKRDDAKFSDQLFLACVVEPAFAPEHLPALRGKSLSALNRVYEAIGRVLKTDVGAAKSAPQA